MRDFFKKEVLDRTYEIFGVRQTDEEKMSDDDIKFLLDGLCQVSKNYSYIPEAEQKKIISACMLSDKTYRNINLRLVAGWLEQNGKKYFTESAHKENKEPENYKPLEGAERDAMLQMWQNALRQMNESLTEAIKPKGGGSRLREQFAPLPTTAPEDSALNEYCNEQAINKQGSEGTGDVTEAKVDSTNTAQPDENFSQQRENI